VTTLSAGLLWLASAAAVLARVCRCAAGVGVAIVFEAEGEGSVSLTGAQDVEALGREVRSARPVLRERRRVFAGEGVARFRGRNTRDGEETVAVSSVSTHDCTGCRTKGDRRDSVQAGTTEYVVNAPDGDRASAFPPSVRC
jgi:hypothetical protein